MNISCPVSNEVKKTRFSFYTRDEILKLSVKQVTNAIQFDALSRANPNGLYDAAFGPTDPSYLCDTCHLTYAYCPGHFGHIDLSVVCFNPLSFKLLVKLLQSTCLYCHHFRSSRASLKLIQSKLILLDAGLIVEAANLDSFTKSKSTKSTRKATANLSLIDDMAIESGNEDEDEEDEGPDQDYLSKLSSYVNDCLSTRPTFKQKTTLATESIRQAEKQFYSSIPSKSCANCRGQSPKFRVEGMIKIFQKQLTQKEAKSMLDKNLELKKLKCHDEIVQECDSDSARYLPSIEVYEHLSLLWKNESDILDLLFSRASPDMFFIHVLPVPPNKFRPLSKLDDSLFEHPQNTYLTHILKSNAMIQDLVSSDVRNPSKLTEAIINLQINVNNFIDNSGAPLVGGKLAAPGIRQLLEKKEGLFRKHMMGKRVNHAARSVISPDPNIETNEIGIPPAFAIKLTYPEPVTPHNINLLTDAVIRGPDKWPGATHIQNEDGTLTNLAAFNESARKSIASQLLTPNIPTGESTGKLSNINKKVYRHIRNGDFLLLNRQPTLHKPSIMCHTSRILPGERTIRMHYANCNTYNADFDGDEMNIHFPQNELARSEAMLILRNDFQYLVPTDGSVLRGLIQDHVCAGVEMTSKNSMFSREEYIQLVYVGLRPEGFNAVKGVVGSNGNIESELKIGDNGNIVLVEPCIIKPVALWSGKQVISTILLNLTYGVGKLNMKSKSKIPAKSWGSAAPEEQSVLVMDGELLTGILDKSQFGASAHGLVHSIHEIFGARYAGKLLSIFGRLFTAYLQFVGFSCRMDDLTLTKQGDKIRRELIQNSKSIGYEAAAEYVGILGEKIDAEHSFKLAEKLEEVLRDNEKMAGLDSSMKAKTNPITSKIISECIPNTLSKSFPKNNMQVMTVSGAKGSAVNVSQISCLLGQQELEGRRVPTMISGKTLPCFLSFETAAKAGGFITGRFLTGIKPSEYFFHCMAGREGLIDTAVKTSRSGYLQRCLIKHLEGLKVCYDNTVRDSDGSVVQFCYGEDGLDVLKQTTLEKFDFCAINYHSLVSRYISGNDKDSNINFIDAARYRKKYLKHKDDKSRIEKTGDSVGKYQDPVLSKFNPSKYLGAVSDRFADNLLSFIDKNPDGLLSSTQKRKWSGKSPKIENFTTLMNLKYQRSLAEPGEAVGLLAAQSIGEPSTQMTLNTFHFAGLGAKNVTLGIPRLREIVMTASSSIKTPMMKLPLKSTATKQEAADLVLRLNRITLGQIIEKIDMEESNVDGKRVFSLLIQFWPKKIYKNEFNVSGTDVSSTLEEKFLPQLERLIMRELKNRLRVAKQEDIIVVGKNSRKETENEEDDAPVVESKKPESDSEDEVEAIDEDGDAAAEKRQKNRTQNASYDAPDEDEVQVEEPEVVADEDSSKDAEIEQLLSRRQFITNYKFDVKTSICKIVLEFPATTKKLLMMSIIEQAAKFTIIRQVQGITRGFIMENDAETDKAIYIGTEGLSFDGIFDPLISRDLIDLANISTNDVYAVLKKYGVEAARATIVREIAGVFGVYGINVDARHLNIIADYMTFEGGYKAFNRTGMKTNPSPFAQMSFETTAQFLTTSTLAGEADNLTSPSACLVTGKVVQGGTGCFQVVYPVEL